MAEGKVSKHKPPEPTGNPPATIGGENEEAVKLLSAMLEGTVIEVKPQLDYTTESGFFYPVVEQVLGVKGGEVVSILDSLVDRGMLKRDFFDRLLRCPQCQSINLRPTTHCPKCGSGNIARGRVLEHFVCKYIGLEEEFVFKGRYMCPKCHQELRTIGSDYQSLGLLRKCRDCGEVFHIPVIKWRCLKCNSLTAEDKVTEVNIYSYRLDEEKRHWLEFELKPKVQLIEFLKQRGYEVTENAMVKGRSGAEHKIDILATRDDGIVVHHIAIGIEVAEKAVELDKVFDFDDKAYDIGIMDKVFIASPGLTPEAVQFAQRQRMRVFEVKEVEPSEVKEAEPSEAEELAPSEEG